MCYPYITFYTLHRPKDRNSKADSSLSGQGVRMFITVFTSAPYWPICWTRWIRSSICHPLTLRHISIPSVHSLFLQFVSFLHRPLCVSFTFLAWFLSQQITAVSCVWYGAAQWLRSNPDRPSVSGRNGRQSDVLSVHAVCAVTLCSAVRSVLEEEPSSPLGFYSLFPTLRATDRICHEAILSSARWFITSP